MTEPEAPDDYVSFVVRHLATLRVESDRLTGARGLGDEIYPEALSDVAARWRWFELMRTRLHRPVDADAYLRRSLVTRAKRWRDEQLYPVEVSAATPRPSWAAEPYAVETVPAPADPRPPRRWRRRSEGEGPGRAVDVSALAAPPLVPEPLGPAPPRRSLAGDRYRSAGPAARWSSGGRVSLGLRQAAFLAPEHRAPAPIAEAAIAWWHAYEATRRRRRLGLAVGLGLLFTGLTQVALRH